MNKIFLIFAFNLVSNQSFENYNDLGLFRNTPVSTSTPNQSILPISNKSEDEELLQSLELMLKINPNLKKGLKNLLERTPEPGLIEMTDNNLDQSNFSTNITPESFNNPRTFESTLFPSLSNKMINPFPVNKNIVSSTTPGTEGFMIRDPSKPKNPLEQ